MKEASGSHQGQYRLVMFLYAVSTAELTHCHMKYGRMTVKDG
jgi:hypothetical protein